LNDSCKKIIEKHYKHIKKEIKIPKTYTRNKNYNRVVFLNNVFFIWKKNEYVHASSGNFTLIFNVEYFLL